MLQELGSFIFREQNNPNLLPFLSLSVSISPSPVFLSLFYLPIFSSGLSVLPPPFHALSLSLSIYLSICLFTRLSLYFLSANMSAHHTYLSNCFPGRKLGYFINVIIRIRKLVLTLRINCACM